MGQFSMSKFYIGRLHATGTGKKIFKPASKPGLQGPSRSIQIRTVSWGLGQFYKLQVLVGQFVKNWDCFVRTGSFFYLWAFMFVCLFVLKFHIFAKIFIRNSRFRAKSWTSGPSVNIQFILKIFV